jgi:hypothetical protein
LPQPHESESLHLQVDCSDPARALHELLALSRRHRTVEFHLRGLDLERSSPLLGELARLRSDHYYAWSLSCDLRPTVGPEAAAQLRRAGVVRATLDPAPFAEDPLRELGFERANLRQLESVRALDEQGIAVEWHLVCDLPGETEESRAVVADWARSAVHLPAPAGLASMGDRAPRPLLEEAIARWQGGRTPRMLTYGCGPDFLRILDRRTNPREWTFIELTAAQSAIYASLEKPRSYSELASLLPAVVAPSLRRLLDLLVQRRLVCGTSDGHYLALPVRRRLDEMWTTGDHAA